MLGEYNGKLWEGEVTDLNGEEKQVCLLTDVQEFWFEPEHLYPIPLNDEQLLRLNFTREMMPDGAIKYKKGPFRLQIPTVGDFSHIDIWYREDRRHNPDIHYIHQLQNHYLAMTKVHLTRELV
jgi:hypothetical protein